MNTPDLLVIHINSDLEKHTWRPVKVTEFGPIIGVEISPLDLAEHLTDNAVPTIDAHTNALDWLSLPVGD